MNILLIEDLHDKEVAVVDCIKRNLDIDVTTIKRSFHSALLEITSNHANYDLILLDMTLPNFDPEVEKNDLPPIPMAGKIIMERMQPKKITTKVIVLTSFDVFENKKLAIWDIEFRKLYDFYCGFVFYSIHSVDWKKTLIKKIRNIL